jgi:DNA replication protein DnaC
MNSQNVFNEPSILDLEPLMIKLRLRHMFEAMRQLDRTPETANWTHVRWIFEVMKREVARREEDKIRRAIQQANLRYPDACLGDIDFAPERNLDSKQIMRLASGDWIRNHVNCIITGKTGTGKTWIASALVRSACMAGFRVRCYRMSQLAPEIKWLKSKNGSLRELLQELRKVDLLVIDDWGVDPLDVTCLSGLLEILDDRAHFGSTLVTSILPVNQWTAYIDNPTVADSILDRLTAAGTQRIYLEGPSLRKRVVNGVLLKDVPEEELS